MCPLFPAPNNIAMRHVACLVTICPSARKLSKTNRNRTDMREKVSQKKKGGGKGLTNGARAT